MSNFSCVFYHQKHKPQHRKTMTKIETRIFVVGMFSETVLKISFVWSVKVNIAFRFVTRKKGHSLKWGSRTRDPRGSTWNPEHETQDPGPRGLGPKTSIFTTRDIKPGTPGVIPNIWYQFRYVLEEKTVVIDDNFPWCVLRIRTQENANSKTWNLA